MATDVSFTSELSQEVSFTYVTKFHSIFISQKMTLSGVDDKQDPLTCVAIAAGKKWWNPTCTAAVQQAWTSNRILILDKELLYQLLMKTPLLSLSLLEGGWTVAILVLLRYEIGHETDPNLTWAVQAVFSN